METEPLYRGGGFEVTGAMLRTPRKSYVLARVEYVEVRRPLLLFLGPPAVGMTGFALAFWRYLQPGEGLLLIGASALTLVVASLFGTLRVHSLALRDDEVAMSFGFVRRLHEVRTAVDAVLEARLEGSER